MPRYGKDGNGARLLPRAARLVPAPYRLRRSQRWWNCPPSYLSETTMEQGGGADGSSRGTGATRCLCGKFTKY